MTTTAHPRTRLDPEVRRGQILAAAARVLADRDPADVTFEEFAAAAGVSRALVYNYFGDKGGLVAAVYIRSLNDLHDELDLAIDPEATAPVRLRAAVHCYLRFAQENAAAWRLLGHTGATDHPEVRRARRARFEDLARGWGGTVEARTAARGLVGFLEATTRDWVESGADDLERMTELLYTILWHGLSAFPVADEGQVTGLDPSASTTRQQYHAATLR
jgi:AcrR family transcriptional regulator